MKQFTKNLVLVIVALVVTIIFTVVVYTNVSGSVFTRLVLVCAIYSGMMFVINLVLAIVAILVTEHTKRKERKK